MSLFSRFGFIRDGKQTFRRVAHRRAADRLQFESLEERSLLAATQLFAPPDGPQYPIIEDGTIATGPEQAGRPASHNAGDYYWHMSERIPLERLDDDILVKLAADADKTTFLDVLANDIGLAPRSDQIISLDSHTIVLSRTPEAAGGARRLLRI